MANQELNIFMITHGPVCRVVPACCIPMEVGASLREHLNYKVRDDIGDNISEKNKIYNELTGLYWIWKNVETEFVGLYHYRRILKINEKEALKVLKQYDIIIPRKVLFYKSIREQYCVSHNENDFIIFEQTLKSIYPEYEDSFNIFQNMREMNLCNMFISKKKLIDTYCEWAFPLFDEIMKQIDIKGRSQYQSRIIGFLSERAFALYIFHNKLKVKEVKMKFVNYDDKLRQFTDNHVRGVYGELRKTLRKLNGGY